MSRVPLGKRALLSRKPVDVAPILPLEISVTEAGIENCIELNKYL